MSTPIPQNTAAFSLDEVTRVTGGRVLRDGHGQSVGVCTDTRQELKEAAFVALRGRRFDGHHFLAQAERGGAALLIVQRCAATDAFLKQSAGPASVIAVDDTLRALGQLASRHRSRWSGKLLAIAGSAGKTTTRIVTQALFEQLRPGKVHGTMGNLNNRIGVPMTLLSLDQEHECSVVEIGTNQPGEVSELARVCAPDAGLLTLIDLEHTEGLGDLEGVEREEGALFDGLNADGAALGNGDDPRVVACLSRAAVKRRATYGTSEDADVCIKARRVMGPHDVRLDFRLPDRNLSATTRFAGPAGSLAVAAGVLAVETLFPGELAGDGVTSALSQVRTDGRQEVYSLAGDRWVIDDSYNSNPASVRSSIECAKELANWAGGRLYLVLGEMLELGRFSRREHETMGVLAARSGAHAGAFVAGDARWSREAARLHGLEAHFFERAQEATDWLRPLLQAGDVVLVKGSRGVRAEVVVEDLREYWRGGGSPP